jgi:hypothetical protein
MDQRLRLLVILSAVCLAAGLGCRDQKHTAGVGGQSGDEGRRMGSPGAGTGGVGPELLPRR